MTALVGKDHTWWRPFHKGQPARKGQYWICGSIEYRALPPNWAGVCYHGVVIPDFFLLENKKDDEIEIPQTEGREMQL